MDSCLDCGVDDGRDTGELNLLLYSSDLNKHSDPLHPSSLQIRTTWTLASNLHRPVPLATVPNNCPETAEFITARIVRETSDDPQIARNG